MKLRVFFTLFSFIFLNSAFANQDQETVQFNMSPGFTKCVVKISGEFCEAFASPASGVVKVTLEANAGSYSFDQEVAGFRFQYIINVIRQPERDRYIVGIQSLVWKDQDLIINDHMGHVAVKNPALLNAITFAGGSVRFDASLRYGTTFSISAAP